MFIGLLSSFGSLLFDHRVAKSEELIKHASLNNWLCQARPALNNVISIEPLYFPLTVSVTKRSKGRNFIDDRYAQICVPSKVKNVNGKKMKKIKSNKSKNWHKIFSTAWVVLVKM